MLKDEEKVLYESLLLSAYQGGLVLVEAKVKCGCPDKAHDGDRMVVLCGIDQETKSFHPLALALPEGFNPQRDLYPPREGEKYGTTVDEIHAGKSEGTRIARKVADERGIDIRQLIDDALGGLSANDELVAQVEKVFGLPPQTEEEKAAKPQVLLDNTNGAVFPPGILSRKKGEG